MQILNQLAACTIFVFGVIVLTGATPPPPAAPQLARQAHTATPTTSTAPPTTVNFAELLAEATALEPQDQPETTTTAPLTPPTPTTAPPAPTTTPTTTNPPQATTTAPTTTVAPATTTTTSTSTTTTATTTTTTDPPTAPPTQPTPTLDQWTTGYLDAGAPPELLPAFLSTSPPGILFCESSHDPTAVRGTADWGLAQINRLAHHNQFENRYGTGTFETLTLDPYTNGNYAGVLALESGLDPWFMSEHCWANAE